MLREARDRLSMADGMMIVREIETGRGGIAKLVQRKSFLKELSQDKLRREHGDVVPLFRVLALPEDKELRAESIVSTSTDWHVAVSMGDSQPGLAITRDKWLAVNTVLLRYDTPVEQCLADVNMLLELAIESLGGMDRIGNQNIIGRNGAIPISVIIEEGMKEDEVIADVSGLKPVVLNFPSHISGRKEMDMLRGLDVGDYDSPDEYMSHRIANKDTNEYFSDKETAELKSMYAKRAPDVKKFLGKVTESAGGQFVYHAAMARDFGSIMQKGLTMFNPSRWAKAGDPDERYQQDGPSVFAFEHPVDAWRWAAKMEWEFKEPAVVIKFKRGDSWEQDPSDDIGLQMGKGRALESKRTIPASDIVGAKTVAQIGTPVSTGLRGDEYEQHVEDVLVNA